MLQAQVYLPAQAQALLSEQAFLPVCFLLQSQEFQVPVSLLQDLQLSPVQVPQTAWVR